MKPDYFSSWNMLRFPGRPSWCRSVIGDQVGQSSVLVFLVTPVDFVHSSSCPCASGQHLMQQAAFMNSLCGKGCGVSLHDIEQAWMQHAANGICEVVRNHPGQRFYAAAFWMFYCDSTAILPPAFAINAVSHVERHDDNEPWSTQWVPAEWHWPVLNTASDPLKPAYAALSNAMSNADDSQWRAVLESHDQVIANVSRTLTSQIHTHSGPFQDIAVIDTFLVAAIDDQRETDGYNALIRSSVEPSRLATIDGLLW